MILGLFKKSEIRIWKLERGHSRASERYLFVTNCLSIFFGFFLGEALMKDSSPVLIFPKIQALLVEADKTDFSKTNPT